MKKDTWRTEWHAVGSTEAYQLTTVTGSPGVVFPYAVSALPASLQALPGLHSAYISGNITTGMSPEGVAVLGEVAAICTGESIDKSYVWVFGQKNDGSIAYNGPYKHFPGHHFPAGDPIPIHSIFGNVPMPGEDPDET